MHARVRLHTDQRLNLSLSLACVCVWHPRFFQIRMLPWLLLDTWRLLVQSAYLRAYPSAFGGVGPHDLYAVRARRDVPDRLLYAVQAATSGANAATTAVEARDAVNQPQSDKPKRPNNDSVTRGQAHMDEREDERYEATFVHAC